MKHPKTCECAGTGYISDIGPGRQGEEYRLCDETQPITPIQHAKQQKQQSARWCPCCGQVAVVPKGEPSPWPKVTHDMIQAAPALLEACQMLVDEAVAFGFDSSNVNCYHMAKAALLKATGKDGV